MAGKAQLAGQTAGGIAEENTLNPAGDKNAFADHDAIISQLAGIIEIKDASYQIMCRKSVLVLLAVSLLLLAGPARAEQGVRIGVLAYNGADRALQRWKPTADYLTRAIPGYRFEILPLTHEAFRNRIRKGQLDFILTNPAHYVQLEVHFGATRIATFRNRFQDKVLTRFGSVIFTRRDRNIHVLSELAGLRLAAVNAEAFGGFLLARRTLMEADIDPLDDMQPLWLGFPQDDIVQAVLEGRAEVGTVRTGILETLAAQGRIDLDRIRVLNQRQGDDFPLLRSTDLYPEWPFARLPQTDEDLARAVAITLLQMPEASPPAEAAGGAGWTIPLDYSGVHEVLQHTQVDPYEPRPLSWSELWQGYRSWILGLLLVFLLLLMAAIQVSRMNRRLKRSEQALTQHRSDLERLVEQRTQQLITANRALKQDIESRIQSEEALQGGCECLQSFHGLITRSDLSREQRLQSILDLMCQFFGAEQVLLSRVEDGQLRGCTHSPEREALPDSLHPDAAQACLRDKQLIERCLDGQGAERRYLACPVMLQGRVICVLEFLSAPLADGSAAHRLRTSNELSMRILQLMAQWLGHERSEQQREDQRSVAAHRLENLTRREKQVLELVVAGRSSKEIARLLEISIKTVELHRSNLLRKSGVNTAVELTRLALEAGLEEETPEKTMQ